MAPPDRFTRISRIQSCGSRHAWLWLLTVAHTYFHSYTTLHIVGDLIALIDLLGVDQVFVVGHDWGAQIAWHLCLFWPDRVKALVNLGIHYIKRNPSVKILDSLRSLYGDDYYMCRFQEPDIETEFVRVGAKAVITKLFGGPEPPMMPKETGLGITSGALDNFPPWYSAEDVEYVAGVFEKTGFTGGLNYYRAFDLIWELTAPWTTAEVKVPVKFIVGDMELMYNVPGVKEYVHDGSFKKDVPLLEEVPK